MIKRKKNITSTGSLFIGGPIAGFIMKNVPKSKFFRLVSFGCNDPLDREELDYNLSHNRPIIHIYENMGYAFIYRSELSVS